METKTELIVFRDDVTIKFDETGVAFTLGARDFKGVQAVAVCEQKNELSENCGNA